jgi:hypothetical protein
VNCVFHLAVTPSFDLPQGGLFTYLRLADDFAALAVLHAEGIAVEQILRDVQADLDA